MSLLLKEVRATLQPQIPDVAGESHPGRNLGRQDLQAYDVVAVCPSSDVTGFGKGITWGGVEFC